MRYYVLITYVGNGLDETLILSTRKFNGTIFELLLWILMSKQI